METGVFKGGTAILMTILLQMYDKCNRKMWGFDSFQGFPDLINEDNDKWGVNKYKQGHFNSNIDEVIRSFQKNDVWNKDLVTLTKGYFNETLPVTQVEFISFLRLDGDLYSSTYEGLHYLYTKVVPGGFIYVDDYGSFPGCRKAVDDFRIKHQIYEPLHYIRENDHTHHILFEAVWWRKRL